MAGVSVEHRGRGAGERRTDMIHTRSSSEDNADYINSFRAAPAGNERSSEDNTNYINSFRAAVAGNESSTGR